MNNLKCGWKSIIDLSDLEQIDINWFKIPNILEKIKTEKQSLFQYSINPKDYHLSKKLINSLHCTTFGINNQNIYICSLQIIILLSCIFWFCVDK